MLSRLLKLIKRISSGEGTPSADESSERKSPVISLLHATRGRSRKALETRKLWLSTANHPEAIEHIFAFDRDDIASKKEMSALRHVEIKEGGTCVKAWNVAAIQSRGSILVQLSDDWTPFQGWDEAILDRLDASKAQVLAVSDGYRKDRLLCMAILTRKRYEQQGHLFHPDFESVFSDDWFTYAAYKDGVVVDARDLVFTHDHPHATSSPLDETYQRNNLPERYQRGEETFARLRKDVYGDATAL